MIRSFSKARAALLLTAGGMMLLGVLVTCTTSQTNTATTSPATTASSWPWPAPQKGSAQLWSETCSRCHNIRSPSAYSAAQWKVIMHDMRIRGELTGQEERQILEFLQSAH